MGDFAREVARDSGQYRERKGVNPSEYYEYAERGRVYDKYREGTAVTSSTATPTSRWRSAQRL